MFQRQRIRTASRTGRTAFRKGVAAVEMAVCLPVLTLFSLAAIETANVVYLKQALVQVAYEGARAGMISSASAADVSTRCNQIITARGLVGTNITVSPSNLSPATAQGTQITVTVTAPASTNAISPAWFFGSSTMTETVCVTRL